MATTNLITQSLGGIRAQSGTGIPNHTAAKGTYYTNTTTGSIYVNIDSTTTWDPLNFVSHGEMYIQLNATTTTISVINTWYSLSGLTWSAGACNDNSVTYSAGKLIITTGRAGKYLILASGAFQALYVTVLEYQLGVSLNGVDPPIGFISGAVTSTGVRKRCPFIQNYLDLVAGDTLQLKMRNTSSAVDGLLRNGGLIITRVSD